MALPRRALGDYWQLLLREGLLAPDQALRADLLARLVERVTCDSQEVTSGTLFVVKGAHFKGEYLAEAIQRGAFVYLSEAPWPQGAALSHIQVTSVRRAMGLLADYYYDHPSGKLAVVGITGTKGKSTTAYYVKAILDDYLAAKGGKESGLISSIDTYDGLTRFESRLTTPEPLDLERHLHNAVEAGLPYVTMECSSQALKYDRMDGVSLAAAAFLNLGRDHISPVEHPDFDDYFQSKLRIFQHSDIAVVNLDCDRAPDILAEARKRCHRVITFSQLDAGADVYAESLRREGTGTAFEVRTPRYRRSLTLSMPGRFNVENALGAVSIAEALGIPAQFVASGLARAQVPGRMEVFQSRDGRVAVIVDYAHNKLSFEKLFASVKAEYPGRRIVAVFGSAGGKALERRRDLGEIAGREADLSYLTEEDPGEEPVLDICRDIAQAVEEAGGRYAIVPDRGEAIRRAILEGEEPTVAIVAAKGRETRQKRGTEYVPVLSDVDYTLRYLAEYNGGGR